MITVSRCARWSRQLVLMGLALLLLGAAEDLRPRLVELQLDGDFESALDTVDRQLEVDAIASAEMGLDYLRGHLFDRLERPDAAIAAFTEALTSTPALTAHVRYRLALDRLQNDEPAMAAGLLVVMLANQPPPELVDEALALLIRSLAKTADGCRLLESWNGWDLDRRQRRALAAALIPCEPSADSPIGTKEWLTGILQSRRTDETARRAAHRLADTDSAALDSTTRLLVGLTLYEHREFDRALPFLEAATVDLSSATRQIQGVDTDDVWYAIARIFY